MSSCLIGQVPTEKNSLNPKSTECQYVPAPISYSIVFTPRRRVLSSYDIVGVVVGEGVKQPYLEIQKSILFWCHFSSKRDLLRTGFLSSFSESTQEKRWELLEFETCQKHVAILRYKGSIRETDRQSVTHNSHTSHHQIFLIFCIKFAFNGNGAD